MLMGVAVMAAPIPLNLSRPGNLEKPVKVHIPAGPSNMIGLGDIKGARPPYPSVFEKFHKDLETIAGLADLLRNGKLAVAIAVAMVLATAAVVISDRAVQGSQPVIAHVFFAQYHVQTPTNALFKLVGNVNALVKVHVSGTAGAPSPEVHAVFKLGERELDLPLKGQVLLPERPPADPLLIEHRYEDSFTAIIPGEWIAPGLQATVELRDRKPAGKGAILDRVELGRIVVGAPNRLVMTMFDFHFFAGDKDGDYPDGWLEGLKARLPVAALELLRVRNILFPTIVQMPRAGQPAVRCSSRQEYREKTGIGYDGKQAQTSAWTAALKNAAGADEPDITKMAAALVEHAKSKWIGGAEDAIASATDALKKATTDAERAAARKNLHAAQADREAGFQALKEREAALDTARAAGGSKLKKLYYSNIYGTPAGGDAWDFSGVGNGRSIGILLHELGHALGALPDLWSYGLRGYPYIGPMSDYPAPGDAPGIPHVGPTWGFDPETLEFLPPVFNGARRRDPMGGGGDNKDGGPGGMYRFFSDYHFSLVRNEFERTQTVLDKRTGIYYLWDQEKGSYSKAACKLGDPGCPVEDGIEVISVLASASLVTPEANIVYPPIGPYPASRIEIFDAASPAAVAKARQASFTDANCHVCLRVTQGGKVRTYLVKDGLNPKTEPTNPGSLAIFAINLPAHDGEVTKIELLDTPAVLSKGLGADCKALDIWAAAADTAGRTITVTMVYPACPAGSAPEATRASTTGKNLKQAKKGSAV